MSEGRTAYSGYIHSCYLDAYALQRSAIIYTIIESCRRRGLDPFAYLRHVFTRLPTMTNWQVQEITPEAWAKTQQRVDGRAAT